MLMTIFSRVTTKNPLCILSTDVLRLLQIMILPKLRTAELSVL